MERYDGHGGDVRAFGQVWQLTGNVTVIREVGKVLKGASVDGEV